MANKAQRGRIYHFGLFQLDADTGVLLRSGMLVKIQEQPLRFLCLLLEHPGEIVSREQLRQFLWPPGRYVELDGSLNTALKRLRSALRDEADHPRYIETVPKRGYRFIAPVDVQSALDDRCEPLDSDWETTNESSGDLPGATRRWRKRSWAVGVAVGLIIVGAGWLTMRQRALSYVSTVHSVAVLPFTGSGADPDSEFLQDGISIGVADGLSQVPGLRVMASSAVVRYAANTDAASVGRDLKVDATLTGKIVRRGDRLYVDAELVRAADNTEIWGGQFTENADRVALFQQEIVQDICDKLRMRLTSAQKQELTSTKVEDPVAYRLYLLGRKMFIQSSPQDLAKAIDLFKQAIARDPMYAAAHAGLADTSGALGYWEPSMQVSAAATARREANTALALDGRSAEAHLSLAGVHWLNWEFAQADAEYRRSEELNPNFINTPAAYSTYLLCMGRFKEAIEQVQRALDLDPLFLYANMQLGLVYDFQSEYGKAIEQFQKTLEIDPRYSLADRELAGTYLDSHRYDEFVEAERRVLTNFDSSPDAASALERVYAASGIRAAYRWFILRMSDQSALDQYSPTDVARYYALLDDKNNAFAWLEKAYEEHSMKLVFLKVDPDFDSLRGDPRYRGLLLRIGFPL
jgi:DNA-binding winged helix-turn-helix (wHTH) protein/TolB-like protein/Tfp pilus assembly protein PilF